jgi:hypothetical protein
LLTFYHYLLLMYFILHSCRLVLDSTPPLQWKTLYRMQLKSILCS